MAAWVVRWAPTLALVAARLAVAYLRFRAEMAAVDVLFAIGWDRAARRVLAGMMRRNRRKLQAGRRVRR